MDIKPYMAKFGFGCAGSRHIVVEQESKLWLAFASEGAGVFMMSSDSLAAGLLEINLMYDGQSIPYTYVASESLLEISSEHGKVSIAVDACARALRFDGEGVALRLDSKDTEQSTTNLNMTGGTVVSMGGGRYFFAAKRGCISFDDTWVRNRFRSKAPVLDITPDDGRLELIAYDLPADEPMPEITKSLGECAEANAAGFKAFCEKLIATPADWGDVRENIAYLMWLNQRNVNGVNVILSNKLRSMDIDPVKLSAASLAFTCPTHAAALITAAQGVSPAAQGPATLRLFKDGLFEKVSRKTVFDLYSTLREHLLWWTQHRTDCDPDLYFYAYRYEAGTAANALFKTGAPVYSPDINTHMILACKALGKLADFTGNTADGEKWRERAKAIKKSLITNLWDGEKFVGKNVYSGEMVEAEEAIALAPIMLGAMLPKEISAILAKNVSGGICDPFTVLGLYRAGYEKQVKQIVTAQLNKARKKGMDDPYCGAALLALAGTVL